MTDVALTPTKAINPATGEVIALDQPTENLGQFLDEAREFESRLREAKALVNDEINRRMDKDASWTLRVGDYILKSKSPALKEEWDEDKLKEILFELTSEGVISVVAMEAALKEETVLKPQPAGIKAVMKLGSGIKERLLVARTETEKPRYVGVEKV